MTFSKANNDITQILNSYLQDSYIDKVTYYITGWNLSFINQKNNCNLISSELEINNQFDWKSLISNSPIEIQDTNDPKDTLTAIVVFTLMNMHKVVKVDLDKKNNLILHFENLIQLKLNSIVNSIDWTWHLQNESGKTIITCDSGELYLNKE